MCGIALEPARATFEGRQISAAFTYSDIFDSPLEMNGVGGSFFTIFVGSSSLRCTAVAAATEAQPAYAGCGSINFFFATFSHYSGKY